MTPLGFVEGEVQALFNEIAGTILASGLFFFVASEDGVEINTPSTVSVPKIGRSVVSSTVFWIILRARSIGFIRKGSSHV